MSEFQKNQCGGHALFFLYNVLTRIDLIVCDFTLLCDDRRTDYRTEGGLFFFEQPPRACFDASHHGKEQRSRTGVCFVLFCFV
jgi:hypothetical protein